MHYKVYQMHAFNIQFKVSNDIYIHNTHICTNKYIFMCVYIYTHIHTHCCQHTIHTRIYVLSVTP